MSYLSKSKKTSFRLSVSRNSLGLGGVVLGAPVAGAGAPLGGGAEAAVVAGRFAHPARKRERTSTGTTSSALPRRCAMSQILLGFMRFVIILRYQIIVSRKARRPRSTCGLPGCPREGLLLRAVGEHGIELIPARQPVGLEDEMAAVRGPRGALVVAGAGGEPAQVRPVGADAPEIEVALARREEDGVTLGGPAGLGIEPRLGEAPHVRALRVHHEDMGPSRPLGHEGDLASGRRPRGLGVDPAVGGQPAEGSGGEVQHVHL